MPAAFSLATPSVTDTLEGIGRAFYASFDREGAGAFGVVSALVIGVLLVVLIWWVLRESRREQTEQALLDARHDTAVSTVASGVDPRVWVRVPAHLRMTVQRRDGRDKLYYDECETQNVSAGGIELLSHAPPPEGLAIQFTLDLREKWPIPLRGIVARVDPALIAGAPSLVAVKLGPISTRERDRLVRWVAREQRREIAEARRGRVCACCRRPLADDASDMHTTCAAGKLAAPARRALG